MDLDVADMVEFATASLTIESPTLRQGKPMANKAQFQTLYKSVRIVMAKVSQC